MDWREYGERRRDEDRERRLAALLDANPKWSASVRDGVTAVFRDAPDDTPNVVTLPDRPEPTAAMAEPNGRLGAREGRSTVSALNVVPIEAARERREARDEPWVTLIEIAEHRGVSERTIRRWMRERGMPYSQPWGRGSCVSFRKSAVDAWCGEVREDGAGPTHKARRPPRHSRARAELEGPSPDSAAPALEGAADLEAMAQRVAELIASRPPEPEPWVGVEAAAAHLACTEQRVRELAKRTDARRVPHRREGHRLLFRLSRLDAWVERQSGAG